MTAIKEATANVKAAIAAVKVQAGIVADLATQLDAAKDHQSRSNAALEAFKAEDQEIIAARATRLRERLADHRGPAPKAQDGTKRRLERMGLEDELAVAEEATRGLKSLFDEAVAKKKSLGYAAGEAITLLQQLEAERWRQELEAIDQRADAMRQELWAI